MAATQVSRWPGRPGDHGYFSRPPRQDFRSWQVEAGETGAVPAHRRLLTKYRRKSTVRPLGLTQDRNLRGPTAVLRLVIATSADWWSSNVGASSRGSADVAITQPYARGRCDLERTGTRTWISVEEIHPEAGSPKSGSPKRKRKRQAGSPKAGSPEAGSPEAGSPEARKPGSPASPEAGSGKPEAASRKPATPGSPKARARRHKRARNLRRPASGRSCRSTWHARPAGRPRRRAVTRRARSAGSD